jgi:hypothetical protein
MDDHVGALDRREDGPFVAYVSLDPLRRTVRGTEIQSDDLVTGSYQERYYGAAERPGSTRD